MDNRQPLFSERERIELSYDYQANPARIRQVYDLCSVLRDQNELPELVLGAAKDLLARSDELLYNRRKSVGGRRDDIDTNILNPSLAAAEVLSYLRVWQQVPDEDREGVNLLFFGLPGTGKTAFARFLAMELMLPFIIKKASDLLSPFVGTTEHLIRCAFEEAEDGVFILDEADSFIQDRGKSRNSWEITRTNEFLTQMEDFRGVFIATTNLSSALDAASFRRFSYKIEFNPPRPEQRLSLAKRFFPSLAWDGRDEELIAELDGITPGAFKAVARRLAYADRIDTLTVIAELRDENDGWKP